MTAEEARGVLVCACSLGYSCYIDGLHLNFLTKQSQYVIGPYHEIHPHFSDTCGWGTTAMLRIASPWENNMYKLREGKFTTVLKTSGENHLTRIR